MPLDALTYGRLVEPLSDDPVEARAQLARALRELPVPEDGTGRYGVIVYPELGFSTRGGSDGRREDGNDGETDGA